MKILVQVIPMVLPEVKAQVLPLQPEQANKVALVPEATAVATYKVAPAEVLLHLA